MVTLERRQSMRGGEGLEQAAALIEWYILQPAISAVSRMLLPKRVSFIFGLNGTGVKFQGHSNSSRVLTSNLT
jgi:hypothetical protein